jgi:5-methylcytosine-specific restriction endonuclease McrA
MIRVSKITGAVHNTIAACGGCNQRKGDRTPGEAGMRLRHEPTAPSWAALTR